MNYKKIVKSGYDELNTNYQDSYANNPNTLKALSKLRSVLEKNSKIIDLGCGTGIPAGKYLVDNGYDVTGVDISTEMVKLSKKNVPKMHCVCGDFSKLSFKDHSFDAGIALFSLLHVAKKDMITVLKEFHRVIKKGGYLLFCVVNSGNFEGYSKFLGKKMFFACFEEKELDKYLADAKFSIVLKYFDTFKIGEEIEKQMFYLVKVI